MGQDGRLVVLDALIYLVRRHLDPGRPHTRPLGRAVVAMHRRDLPLLDGRRAAEHLRAPIADRRYLFPACMHGFRGLPGTGGDAPAGLPVDQKGYADAPIHPLQCGHNHIANVRNSGVDALGLRLNSGRARVHDPPLFHCSGQRPGGATGQSLPSSDGPAGAMGNPTSMDWQVGAPPP
ncbi:Uncharacterised protein [Mycobacterium tuberculosis]|uniref:Uncharacterized protein n=1 Tax=Mycobacterium tuberculosis TaxID=1773 RepID=A0A655IT51_MYCTX|nr:Uncharacterised protein [Mycobacterium tuberculosis]